MALFKRKSEEDKYLEKLDKKEMSERAALDDGGYKFSLSTGLQKRSRSEQDEDAYLAEQENKDRSELAIHKKAIAKQNIREVGKSASEAALSGIKAVGRGMQSGIQYAGSTQIAQYAGSRAKGALSYIPEKFETARLDYEAGKISKKTYESAYRQHKIDTAETRGSSSEQRKYREKIRKETDELNREKARKDIAISAERAYQTERAKTAGRIAARQARQEAKQQYVVVGQSPRRRQWARPDFTPVQWRQPNEFELDPMNLYSMRTTQTQQKTVTNSRVDLSHMHSLLGYYPNRTAQPAQAIPKVNTNFAQEMLGFSPQQQSQQSEPKAKVNKIKRRKLNIFTGQVEWV